MKCPKCGFNSFECYDSCKKCSADLTSYKQTYSITSLILPQDVKATLAAEIRSNESSSGEIDTAPEVHDDMFSFDLPDDVTSAPSQSAEDLFDFTEPVTETHQANNGALADDIFGDLLESTPQPDASLFAARVSTEAEPAAPSSPAADKFDFDSFSWDDSPDSPAPSEGDDTADDFDAFFEDAKVNSSS